MAGIRTLTAVAAAAAAVAVTGAVAQAAPPPVSFAAPVNYPIYPSGRVPFSVAAGDLNGDGAPDLATANQSSGNLSVLLGNGDGSFGPPTAYATGNEPISVAIADLNGDGYPDLAAPTFLSGAVAVLLGNGDGSFRAQTTYPAGSDANALAVADLNGDGRLDLAVTNQVGSDVSVLLGNGDGSFQPRTTFATQAGPFAVAAADLNGDGRVDLAVANHTSSTVSVLLGNGDGTFQPQTVYATGRTPVSVAISDLNGDGRPDLALANQDSNTLSVLLGNGDGTFRSQTSYAISGSPRELAAADLNGDGAPDLAVVDSGNVVLVLLGNGDGTLQPPTAFPTYTAGGTAGAIGVAAADLNGDGRPDLAVTNANSTVSVLLNTKANLAPVVDAGAGGTVDEGSPFSGGGSFGDPDSSSWSATVDYGDGTGVQPLPLSGDAFALRHVYDDNGTYEVTVTVTDDGGKTGSATAQVVVDDAPPTATLSAGSPIDEGGTSTLSLDGATDPSSADRQAGFRYSFACDGDTSSLAASYADGGADSTATCPFADDGTYTVAGRILDKDGGQSTYTAVVTVANVAPVVGAISAPADPVALGGAVSIAAPFADPGTLDTHTAVVSWGDGTSSPATVAEADGSGTVAASHAYGAAGVYTIVLTVADKDGASGQATYSYVVVYDPSGSGVRGSGTVLSPAGAYAPDPSLAGEAKFGFDSSYKRGATTPDGHTHFRFKAAGFTFVSTSYDWLVVAGAKAQFKGTGTVNGSGSYGFLLTATDGDVTGGGGVDRFRIKIWDLESGGVVYDNQQGADDTAGASEAIASGDITIK